MAFNIGALIQAMRIGGRVDPAAIIAAAGGPSAGAPPVGAVPSDGAPPPEAPPAQAQAYQSPPDLVAMYTKLMEKAQISAAIQKGGAMIGAGLSPYQDTRDSILATIGKGGGGGTGGMSMSDIIALQKQQQEQGDRAARAAQLPALMKQYGLDPATVQYLDTTGGLDTVIEELAKPHTQVVQSGRAGQMLIDTRDGHLIKQLSPDNPRDTEFIDVGGGNHLLVYKDDKTAVGDGKQIVFTGPTPGEAKTLADTAAMPAEQKLKERAQTVSEGQLAVNQGELGIKEKDAAAKAESRKTRELYLPAIQKQFGITEAAAAYLNETDALDEFIKEASKPNNEVVKAADGSQLLVDKNSGATIRTLSPKAAPETQYVDQADGSKVLVDKVTGRRIDNGELLSATPPKDELATPRAAVAAINADEEARGVPKDRQTKLGDYVKTHGTGAGGGPLVQVGPSGEQVQLPTLEKDFMYIPDENNPTKPKMFPPDAKYNFLHPISVPIPGSAADVAQRKALADAAAAEAKNVKTAEGGAKSGVREDVKTTITNHLVKESIDLINKHEEDFVGITGIGAAMQYAPWASDAKTLANNLDSIKTHIGIDEIKSMRADSPTGAALGNVTNYEDKMLKSVMGPMNQWNDPFHARYDLQVYGVASEMLSHGVVDPNEPDPHEVEIDGKKQMVPNPEHKRLPTQAEVEAEIAKIPTPEQVKSGKALKEGEHGGFQVIEEP